MADKEMSLEPESVPTGPDTHPGHPGHGDPGHSDPGHGSPGTTDPGTGSPSTGGSSSSSSSTPSSSSSTPAVDPVVAAKEASFKALYQQLWGEPPTDAYIKHFAESGMNIWEFEDHERSKPAFRMTKTYADQASSFVSLLRSWGVVDPAFDRLGKDRPDGGWPGKNKGGGGQNPWKPPGGKPPGAGHKPPKPPQPGPEF